LMTNLAAPMHSAQPDLAVDISFFFQKINRALASIAYGDEPAELYDPIRYMMELGGKRIRPTLTLLAGHLFKEEVDALLKPAIGIEVFHNFTLLHDDLMDQAPLRRGQPAVHEKWNPNIAILSGDVMLVRAYELFLEVPPAKLAKVLRLFSHTAAQVCEGQQLDMNFERQQEVSIGEYLQMITLKTAVLLGLSLEMGAYLNDAPEEDALLLKNFGINVGIAFQLRDDLLDVYGAQEIFGKLVGGDILADKKTFLVLTALAQANENQRNILSQFKSQGGYAPEEKVQQVTAVYDELDIKTQTEEKINQYFETAIQSLDAVRVAPARKAMLRHLALQLMERES
jgi:geranylgeranyl diphosphate synthase type II